MVRVSDIKEILPKKVTLTLTLISLLSFSLLTYHVLNHLPVIDFRAYAVGKNIQEGMEFPEDDLEALPPIQNFVLEDTQNDLTEQILEEEKAMLIIIYELKMHEENGIKIVDEEGFSEIKKVADKAIKKNYKVYGVTSSFPDELITMKKKYDLPFDFLFGDGTTLKTMIRANPGIITLKKGTVTGKCMWTDASKVSL